MSTRANLERKREYCFAHPNRRTVASSKQPRRSGVPRYFCKCVDCDVWLYECDAHGQPIDLKGNKKISDFFAPANQSVKSVKDK